MKLRLIWLMSLFLCVMFSFAQESSEKMMLFIELKNGDIASHVLENTPVITFNEGSLTVTDPKTTTSYNIVEVDHFYFAKANVASIDYISADEIRTQWIEEDVLRIYFVNPCDLTIVVYSINGHKMNPELSYEQGYVDISLKEFASGVYMITFNNQSIKVLKK